MDIKQELSQVRALLRIALENCDVTLSQSAVNYAQVDCVLVETERAVIRMRTIAETVRVMLYHFS